MAERLAGAAPADPDAAVHRRRRGPAGPALEALYRETWDAYRAWWLGAAGGNGPTRAAAEAALHHHMPELAEVHAQLVALAGDDDTAAAMLTLWNPPPFIVACSQVVVPDRDDGEPVLLRNYDYDPRLFEATIYRSRWGSRVLGTGDCLWGLVDGVNDDGLAVSLTFGGRREVGEGFGIPLVIRYLLEVAADVAEGIEVLRRLPHQISYNVTLCDRSGRVATVMISPDRPALVTDRRAVTNHPETVEWPEHSAWVGSVERLDLLQAMSSAGADDVAMTGRCFSRRCWRGNGTPASPRCSPPPTGPCQADSTTTGPTSGCRSRSMPPCRSCSRSSWAVPERLLLLWMARP